MSGCGPVRGSSSPRRRLQEWQERLTRAVNRAFQRHDMSRTEVAAECGTTAPVVRRWCEIDRTNTPHLAHVAMMPREVVIDVLAPVLESHGLYAAERGDGTPIDNHMAHLHRVIAECGDVQREYASALSTHGGAIVRAERERILDEVREAERAMARLRRGLEAEAEVERRAVRSIA